MEFPNIINFKIIVLGFKVTKTLLRNRKIFLGGAIYKKGEFFEHYNVTVEVEYSTKMSKSTLEGKSGCKSGIQ
jgi:hypothetical protein